MPFELSDLITKRVRTVAIPVTADETFAVRYSPDAMTPDVWSNLQGWVKANADQEADPFAVATYVIVPLVKGWDLTSGGEPYPVTVENVVALGLPLVAAIAGAIMTDFNDARDTRDAKKGSGAPSSSPTIPAPDSLIGTSP